MNMVRILLALLLCVGTAQAQIITTQPTSVGTATPGQIPGAPSNTAATAGNIGEYISSTVLTGSAVSLTNATAANVTSVSLTAGNWLCSGSTFYTLNAATTSTLAFGWISSTSATLPTQPGSGGMAQTIGVTYAANLPSLNFGPIRFSLSGTTTVYLSTQVSFATNTAAAYGFIGCVRVN